MPDNIKKILVFGETCEDIFNYCSCDRVAPDKPCQVVQVEDAVKNLGLAANTVANLRSLNPDWKIYFYTQKSYSSKTRYVDKKSNHYFLRVDHNDKVPSEERIDEPKFYKYLEDNGIKFDEIDAAVISEYGKGLVSKEFIYFISQLAKMYNIPVFIDTKFTLNSWSQDTIVKINRKEYNENLKTHLFPEKYCKELVVTLGEEGTWWVNKNKIFHAEKVEISDLSGAGDSHLAFLVTKYLETGGDLEKSIIAANKAAAYAVTQKGVVAVKRENIKE